MNILWFTILLSNYHECPITYKFGFLQFKTTWGCFLKVGAYALFILIHLFLNYISHKSSGTLIYILCLGVSEYSMAFSYSCFKFPLPETCFVLLLCNDFGANFEVLHQWLFNLNIHEQHSHYNTSCLRIYISVYTTIQVHKTSFLQTVNFHLRYENFDPDQWDFHTFYKCWMTNLFTWICWYIHI